MYLSFIISEFSHSMMITIILVLCLSVVEAVTEEHTVNIKLNDNVPKSTTVGKIWKSLNQQIYKEVHHIIIGSTTFTKFHEFFKISQKGEIITIKYIDRDNREEICGPLNCCAKDICDFQTNVVLTYLITKSIISFQINFEIFDENDNSPKFSQLKFNINVLEEQKHYRMSLPTAYDLDSSINGVYNYSLSENHKKFFQLSIQNGYPELLVLSSFDYENIAERKFHLQLTAFDRGGRFETMNLFIITIDINDNKPIFEKEIYKIVVKENTTYTNPLLVLRATDKDGGDNGKINYKIDSLTSPDIMDKFLLNKSNGEIRLIQKLDYEIYSDQLIELTIEAVDEGSPQFTGVCKLEVRSSDINDNAPRIEILKNISIAENKRVFTPVMSLYIHDDDSIQNKVQCYKKNNENFRLHSTQENSLIIYTESIFDFENSSLVRLDIQCLDSGVPPMITDKTLYISILDENDNFPIFDRDIHKYQVSEDMRIGEFIFQSTARDLDSGKFGKIFYRMDNIGNRDFSINISTGQVHLLNSLDRELKDTIEFTIYAVDGGGLESSVKVSIIVMDVNDNPPKLKSPKILNVMENERVGALIGKIEVWDPDDGENARVTLENEAEENALFYSYLKLEDNKIYIKSSIDREKVSQIFLRLKLIDHGRPKLTSWDTITISIIDENDNDPILIYPTEGDMINSRSLVFVNTPFHSLVLNMQAKDLDFDENGKVKFRILDDCNGSRYFHVNETSGDIYSTWSCRSGQYLSCPMPGLYRLNIELKDGSSSTSRMTKSHFFITIHEYSETNGLVEFNSNSFFKNVIILVMIVVFSIVLAVGLVGAIVWARTRQSVQFNVCSNTPSNSGKKNLKPNHWFYDPQLLLPDNEIESQFLNVEKSNFTSGTPPNEIILHKLYSNNLDDYDRSSEIQVML